MYNNYYPYNYRPHTFFGNFKKINWSNTLDKTQKTLSIINQAIPVIYQIRPLINNAKTAFKVVNAIKESPKTNTQKKENIDSSNNSPTYFL